MVRSADLVSWDGEAGQAIAQSLHRRSGQPVSGFDIRAVGEGAQLDLSDITELKIASDRAELASDADIILSVVTADDAMTAASGSALSLRTAYFYRCKFNLSSYQETNCSTGGATGASYLDMAIMAPILPRGHKTPVLVAGPGRARLTPILDEFEFDYDWRGEAGEASMVRMLRSILIKA